MQNISEMLLDHCHFTCSKKRWKELIGCVVLIFGSNILSFLWLVDVDKLFSGMLYKCGFLFLMGEATRWWGPGFISFIKRH
jgi:hypothetical protein